jgi:hypothetical protein
MEAASISETSANIFRSHIAATHKAAFFVLTAMRTSDLTLCFNPVCVIGYF